MSATISKVREGKTEGWMSYLKKNFIQGYWVLSGKKIKALKKSGCVGLYLMDDMSKTDVQCQISPNFHFLCFSLY